MKKMIYMLPVVLSFGCANQPFKPHETRAPSSTSEKIEGIVSQAECNRPTGFGVVEVRVKNGSTIESNWYKVKSHELCSMAVPGMLFQSATKLGELAMTNNMSDKLTITSLKIVDDFVVEANTIGKVDTMKYNKDIKEYQTNDSVREVHEWYFQNRKNR